MKCTIIVGTALLVTLGVTPHRTEAQPLTAAMFTAPGFVPVPPELIPALEVDATYYFKAKREQPTYPWGSDGDISLACSWTENSVAELFIQMLIDAPEEQPDTVMSGMAWHRHRVSDRRQC